MMAGGNNFALPHSMMTALQTSTRHDVGGGGNGSGGAANNNTTTTTMSRSQQIREIQREQNLQLDEMLRDQTRLREQFGDHHAPSQQLLQQQQGGVMMTMA